ncbi:hypothetical protein D3C75_810390 [compost metagenome]
MPTAIEQRGADADLQTAIEPNPVGTAICTAQNMPTKAIDKHLARLPDDAEIGAVIRSFQSDETLPGSVPFQHQTLFASDVQRIARRGDGIEVKALRVVDAILERCPAAAAILGAQDQVEHPDHITDFVVGEPDAEKRLVGAFIDQPLAVGGQYSPLFVVGFGLG